MSTSKLRKALADLERALAFKSVALTDSVYYGAIAKAFEVAVEYAWKYFRRVAIDSGFDVQSPRDAIKCGQSLKLIDDAELWLGFLKVRNIAVHDYVGVSPEEYLATAEQLHAELVELEHRLPLD